jgi:homoserine dehydrogenase
MSEFRIGIAGLGVVGAETARQLITAQERLSKRAGKTFKLLLLVQERKIRIVAFRLIIFRFIKIHLSF